MKQRITTAEEFGALCDACEGLAPVWIAAIVGNVSRQRMAYLVEQGRFPAFTWWGATFVGLGAVRRWALAKGRCQDATAASQDGAVKVTVKPAGPVGPAQQKGTYDSDTQTAGGSSMGRVNGRRSLGSGAALGTGSSGVA